MFNFQVELSTLKSAPQYESPGTGFRGRRPKTEDRRRRIEDRRQRTEDRGQFLWPLTPPNKPGPANNARAMPAHPYPDWIPAFAGMSGMWKAQGRMQKPKFRLPPFIGEVGPTHQCTGGVGARGAHAPCARAMVYQAGANGKKGLPCRPVPGFEGSPPSPARFGRQKSEARSQKLVSGPLTPCQEARIAPGPGERSPFAES